MVHPKVQYRASPRLHGDGIAVHFGSSQDSCLIYDATNDEVTIQTKDAGGTFQDRLRIEANTNTPDVDLAANPVKWTAGRAVTAGDYSVGRDADGTNQLHFNVPTGVTLEWSVNDAAEMVLSATQLDLKSNAIADVGASTWTADQTYNDNVKVTLGTGGDADIYYDGTNLVIEPQVVGSGNVIINDAAILFLNETLNADMTVGLTINQGANDDDAIALKSSDVAHGITAGGGTETDSYGVIQKVIAEGGLYVRGWSAHATDPTALKFRAISTAEDTVKSTIAAGVVDFWISKKSGTGNTDLGADGNLLTIRDKTITRFIFDVEGSAHADVEWVTYSDDRLKFNQREIPYGLHEVLQLRPKLYERDSGYLDNGVPVLEGRRITQAGFVAQDVLPIMPELVRVPLDPQESWYSMDTGRMTTVLVRAIQELNTKMEVLHAGD